MENMRDTNSKIILRLLIFYFVHNLFDNHYTYYFRYNFIFYLLFYSNRLLLSHHKCCGTKNPFDIIYKDPSSKCTALSPNQKYIKEQGQGKNLELHLKF